MIRRRDDGGAGSGVPATPFNEQEVRSMAGEGEVTIVGQGAKLEGTLVSAGSLRVDGQVKGQINAEGDVMLSPQSHVEADIRADSVTVAGRFKGNIFVKGKAELARGGRIDGNVTSKVLVVQEGGVFCGQSMMDQEHAPPPSAQAGSTAAGAAATAGGNAHGTDPAKPSPEPTPERARVT
jgi:cytoskeletal protein CcmA (bactofilin family)